MRPDDTPVFPILPSYSPSGHLDLVHTAAYVRYLQTHGATTVMTTAGTSQFNLMSSDEILEFNACVVNTFSGRVILGVPALSEVLLDPFLAKTSADHPTAELLLTYPERLYGTDDITNFFIRVARSCPLRINIHGLPLRSARGGFIDFDSQIIDAILDGVDNVTGMKEECSTYEAGFTLCSSVSQKKPFEFIVAGGSMRRYLFLQAAGAQSFFAGVGSLFPAIELAFSRHCHAGRLREATLLISELETPTFAVFMDIGWHKALRHAARCLGLISISERKPMPEPTREEKARIERALVTLRERTETVLGMGEL